MPCPQHITTRAKRKRKTLVSPPGRQAFHRPLSPSVGEKELRSPPHPGLEVNGPLPLEGRFPPSGHRLESSQGQDRGREGEAHGQSEEQEGGTKPRDTTPRPHPRLRVLYKKHLLGRILWSSKWLSVREKKAQLHRRTQVCICDVEDGRKSTAPFRGRVVGGGGRKEAAVPLGLQRRKDSSLCGSARRGAWASPPRPPVAQGLHYQLTMGSTSASRSRSSWISSVLPESLLATELGDGEFLKSMEGGDFQ